MESTSSSGTSETSGGGSIPGSSIPGSSSSVEVMHPTAKQTANDAAAKRIDDFMLRVVAPRAPLVGFIAASEVRNRWRVLAPRWREQDGLSTFSLSGSANKWSVHSPSVCELERQRCVIATRAQAAIVEDLCGPYTRHELFADDDIIDPRRSCCR